MINLLFAAKAQPKRLEYQQKYYASNLTVSDALMAALAADMAQEMDDVIMGRRLPPRQDDPPKVGWWQRALRRLGL